MLLAKVPVIYILALGKLQHLPSFLELVSFRVAILAIVPSLYELASLFLGLLSEASSRECPPRRHLQTSSLDALTS